MSTTKIPDGVKKPADRKPKKSAEVAIQPPEGHDLLPHPSMLLPHEITPLLEMAEHLSDLPEEMETDEALAVLAPLSRMLLELADDKQAYRRRFGGLEHFQDAVQLVGWYVSELGGSGRSGS